MDALFTLLVFLILPAVPLNHPALHDDIFLTDPSYIPVSPTGPSLSVDVLSPFRQGLILHSEPSPVRTPSPPHLASDTSCKLPTYVDGHFVLLGLSYPPNELPLYGIIFLISPRLRNFWWGRFSVLLTSLVCLGSDFLLWGVSTFHLVLSPGWMPTLFYNTQLL